MDEIQIFKSKEFGNVRTLMFNNEPYLVGKDVAVALGYAKPENALSAHVDDEDKTITLIQGSGSNYKSNTTIINESGLYSLVFSSQLPSAKKFKRWVTGEILPSIRKNGGYVATTQEDTPELIMARALQVAQATITKHQQMLEQANKRLSIQDNQIKKLQPKADFADAAFKAEGNVDIGQAAKILGLPFGRNTLFKKLREKGVFFANRNEPKQRFVEAGYFKLTELPPIKRDHHPDIITMKCICTQKGLAYINTLFGGSLNNPTLATIK